MGVGAGALVFDGLEQAGALIGGGDKRGIPHVERLEKTVMQQAGVAGVGGGGQGVAEQIVADVGVDGRCAGGGCELLFRQPGPAVGTVGEGEVGRFGRIGADFARQAGGVGSQIEQCDVGSVGALWDFAVRRGVFQEWIGEGEIAFGDELREQVGGEDFGDGAEADFGAGVWRAAAAGGGFAVALDEDFVVVDDGQHHAGYGGLIEDGLAALGCFGEGDGLLGLKRGG